MVPGHPFPRAGSTFRGLTGRGGSSRCHPTAEVGEGLGGFHFLPAIFFMSSSV